MQQSPFSPTHRRGITVLALLLIIIAVILVAFFVVSYLRTQPAQVQSFEGTRLAPIASVA